MAKRRRWITGLILAFLVGMMAVGWFGSRAGNPDVKLLFLQYTNAPVVVASSTNPNPQYTTQIWTQALLLATNAGSVPVRYVQVWKVDSNIANAYLDSDIWGMPAVLKAGESAVAHAFWPTGQWRWKAGIGLRRDGLRDRLADKFGKYGYDGLEQTVRPSAFSDDVFWIYSDWLTNLPANSNAPLSSAPPSAR